MDSPSAEQARLFQTLQERLALQYREIFPDPSKPRTVVVIPSLSMDAEVLSRVAGVEHYEERMLCMLMLLRMPRTQVLFLSGAPIAPAIIDYYLHLLPGIPGFHARRRLTLLTTHDTSPIPLTQKILDRPRLVRQVRAAMGDPLQAHMTCFNVTALERRLALALDIPIYGCDPALADLGSKSGSREVFREAGLDFPDGFERLRDAEDVLSALSDLKTRNPALSKAVVKLEEGASGEGNAVFDYGGCPRGAAAARSWIARETPRRLRFVAKAESWEHYRAKLSEMGGIVESWIEGSEKESPSVQCRIDPLGCSEIISTHDQILGGSSGQVFTGSSFPAAKPYRLEIQQAGLQVAEVLAQRGALGRFSVDFVSVQQEGRWRHFAIEINLRKGGTTHTFMTLQFLTDGSYEVETGLYRIPTGPPRFYYASDNLTNPRYRGLLPGDLMDIAVDRGLHFHGATQQGVVFHLIGTLSQYGKLGLVCVGDSEGRARELYEETIATLDAAAEAMNRDRPTAAWALAR